MGADGIAVIDGSVGFADASRGLCHAQRMLGTYSLREWREPAVEPEEREVTPEGDARLHDAHCHETHGHEVNGHAAVGHEAGDRAARKDMWSRWRIDNFVELPEPDRSGNPDARGAIRYHIGVEITAGEGHPGERTLGALSKAVSPALAHYQDLADEEPEPMPWAYSFCFKYDPGDRERAYPVAFNNDYVKVYLSSHSDSQFAARAQKPMREYLGDCFAQTDYGRFRERLRGVLKRPGNKTVFANVNSGDGNLWTLRSGNAVHSSRSMEFLCDKAKSFTGIVWPSAETLDNDRRKLENSHWVKGADSKTGQGDSGKEDAPRPIPIALDRKPHGSALRHLDSWVKYVLETADGGLTLNELTNIAVACCPALVRRRFTTAPETGVDLNDSVNDKMQYRSFADSGSTLSPDQVIEQQRYEDALEELEALSPDALNQLRDVLTGRSARKDVALDTSGALFDALSAWGFIDAQQLEEGGE